MKGFKNMGKYTKKTDMDENIVEEGVVEQEVSEKEFVKTTKTTKKTTKKTFEPTEEIRCRSVIPGKLFLDGAKTGRDYRWEDYGDETGVEYADLVSLVRSKSGYIFNPFFVIDDEDFISEFPDLNKFYSANYSVKELSEVLSLPVNEMISTIKTLPKSAVDSLKSIAANQVSTGQIDSVRKIRALDDLFGTDLNLISELFIK